MTRRAGANEARLFIEVRQHPHLGRWHQHHDNRNHPRSIVPGQADPVADSVVGLIKAENQTPAAARADERSQEPSGEHRNRPPRAFSELVVAGGLGHRPADEIGAQQRRARVEDRVEARVVRDVRVGGEIAIPAGSTRLAPSSRRAGRQIQGTGATGHSLSDAGPGRRHPTPDHHRNHLSPRRRARQRDAARIGGGAVIGAIIGGIVGGGKGAAIGATTGAGAGTASVMAGESRRRNIPRGRRSNRAHPVAGHRTIEKK